jgi:hypothetical protein
MLHRGKDVTLEKVVKQDAQQLWSLHLLLEPRMTLEQGTSNVQYVEYIHASIF